MPKRKQNDSTPKLKQQKLFEVRAFKNVDKGRVSSGETCDSSSPTSTATTATAGNIITMQNIFS